MGDTDNRATFELNILDLCFFRSLKSRVDKLKDAQGLEGIVDNVKQAWEDYDWQTLERCWGVQAESWRQIMKDGGGNQHPDLHSGITKRQRNGEKTVGNSVPKDIYLHAQECLKKLRIES